MAFYFINREGDSREGHVGTNFLSLLHKFWVVRIQADGHELEWVFKKFPHWRKNFSNDANVIIFTEEETAEIMNVIRPLPKVKKTYRVNVVNSSYLTIEATSSKEAEKMANEILNRGEVGEVNENSTGWEVDFVSKESND